MIINRFRFKYLPKRYLADRLELLLKFWQPLVSRGLPILLIAILGIGVTQASDQQPTAPETSITEPVTIADPATELVNERTEPATLAAEIDESSALATSETEQRLEQIASLQEEINLGTKSWADADALYEELSRQLRIERKRLKQALRWTKSPTDILPDESAEKDRAATEGQAQSTTVEDVYNRMVSLYQARVVLLEIVSPELTALVTSFGEAAQIKFKGEMEYMVLYLRFHAMAIPQLGPRLLDSLITSPLPVIWELLKLIVAVTLFRWWRQWAPQGLTNLRGRILQARPRRQYSLRIARSIWYFQELLAPLEWMLLLYLFFNAMAVPALLVIANFAYIILNGVLLAWLAVRILDAITSRRVAGLNEDSSGQRLRSFQLIAGWLLVLTLGLQLTETYTGKGTTYAMVWALFEFLSIPVIVLLLAWWRPDINQKLTELPALPGWVAITTQSHSGLRKYLGTLLGAVYLIFIMLRQLLIRQLSKFESGREILVTLIGRELYRDQDRKEQIEESSPISDQLADRIINGEGQIEAKVFSAELKQISEIIEFGHGGVTAVVGERGIGKSLLLQRLSTTFDDKAIIIECTMHGFDGIKQAFAQQFSIPEDQLNSCQLVDLIEQSDIRFIAFDNLHLLARPKMDGAMELNRLNDFLAPLRSKSNISLIVTMLKPAYMYINSIRSDRSLLESTIELSAWSLEQTSGFIDARSQQAGIEPDFSRIDIPHQYDEADNDSLDERTRSGFYRILWNVSAGNPSVALRLWCNSLALNSDGRTLVQILPELFSGDQLDKANLSIMLMLRVITQSGMTNADDITESLQLPPATIEDSLRFALLRGWVEETDGYYQITWRWFRTINRILVRQNLLAR